VKHFRWNSTIKVSDAPRLPRSATPRKRSRKKIAADALWSAIVAECKRDPERGNRCRRCRRLGDVRGHHWLPKGRGGPNEKWNCMLMCFDCHRWTHDNTKEAEAAGWLLTREVAIDRGYLESPASEETR
jgi:5-methylcytosine-specific restriction endonuclease McrA